MNDTIEPVLPVTQAEVRDTDTVSRNQWKIISFISVIVLSGMNLVAAFYLYSASSDLSRIEARLEKLSVFEDRVLRRLDSMNNGVQSQFDRQNANVQASFRQIFSELDAVRRTGSGTPRNAAQSETGEASSRQLPSTQPALPAADDGGNADGKVANQARPAEATKRVPVGARYERIESADGKVYYKKIR